mgnify:CR=1 FL=1
MPTPDTFTAKPPDAFAERHPELLRQLREVLAKYPVRAAYLFGSYARGDERPDSDVDVYVQIDRSKGSFGLFELYDLHEDLKHATGREVDVATDFSRHVWPFIEQDLILLYAY